MEVLFSCLDPQHILQLLAALFGEQQIIVLSVSQARLAAVIHSVIALMHPFTWQHMYASTLPPSCSTWG